MITVHPPSYKRHDDSAESDAAQDAEEAALPATKRVKLDDPPSSNKLVIKEEIADDTYSSSRPRRSRRSGLGKLGKWLRYPGEESSDEDDNNSKAAKQPRKKFGSAMAASLRKAARDEMTSPTPQVKSKHAPSTFVNKPILKKPQPANKDESSGSSPTKTVRVKVASVEDVKKILSFTAANGAMPEKQTTQISLVGKASDVSVQDVVESTSNTNSSESDSPKKYIVINKNKTTTLAGPVSNDGDAPKLKEIVTDNAKTTEISNETLTGQDETTASLKAELTAADAENGSLAVEDEAEINNKPQTEEEKEMPENGENGLDSLLKEKVAESTEPELNETNTVKYEAPPTVEAKGGDEAAPTTSATDATEVSNTALTVEDGVAQILQLKKGDEEQITISATIDKNGELVIRRLNKTDGEDLEEGEVVADTIVEVGTQEEVVGTPQQKNTIADLDGTDALTALVNVAISADKVPDPIAMVAADLYDPQNADDDCDTDEFRVRYKQRMSGGYTTGADTADEEEGQRVEGLRKRRKKRKPGDDPELEELERKTKVVEGPNGTAEFACGICNKHFTQLKYLKLHLPAHTDRYRCQVCGKRFARNESLLKHTCDDTASLVEQTIDADGNDGYLCRECGREFSELSFAVRHASMHRTRYSCEKCGRSFLKQELLDEHNCRSLLQEDGEEAQHECQICKQSFTSGKYLFRHMAMHTDIYKCEKCNKCYSRKDSLQRHISRCCPELSSEYSVHVCPNCKKTFGTKLGLQNHMLNCGKYQCTVCKVAYFSLRDLEEHECSGKVINEKASVQFPCKECNKTFASIAYLVRHEASHHGAFKCNICERVFIRKEELNWHTPVCATRQKIQQEGSAQCTTCGETFNEWLAFKDHHMTHTHPYKCEKCGKRFIKIGTLHNHKCEAVGEPSGDPNDQLSCNICQKTFKNERYLQRHLTLHGQPEFTCEFCGKFFTRKDYLNDHQCRLPNGTTVRVVRKKNRLFIKDNLSCPVCSKKFSSRSNMMKHMKVHGEKLAECHICHKRFHYENYLKLHIATVHEKQYQLQCPHCSKVLFSKTGLIAHIKQFHADTIKLYPCPKCGKTFRQKGNMKTHLISHTKERAYRCDVCGKAFKYPDQLNRHHLEHTLSQKYACELCDKQFVRMYELRNHMRNYHSGFVYVCGICHECCAHRHTIIRHYKRKHPEVGNVFEEKPEFLDSLQKPISAATQSRMMLEAEDVKPTIVRVGHPPARTATVTGLPGTQHHQIMVTTGVDDDTVAAFQGGELILQQPNGDLVQAVDQQAVQHVLEGQGGDPQTLFVLKVMNQDESGAPQEMELTEETKAYLAQLLQQHSATGGPDAITHIQLGDQTLQIQRQEEEGEDEEMDDIKFDPGAEIDGVVVASSSGESVAGMVGNSVMEVGKSVVTSEGLVSAVAAGMEGVQVVEMEDGQLSRILHMDGSQMLGSNHQIFQMEGGQMVMAVGGEDGQQMVVSAADLVAAAQEQQQQEVDQHAMVVGNAAAQMLQITAVKDVGADVTDDGVSQLGVEVSHLSEQHVAEAVHDPVVTSYG